MFHISCLSRFSPSWVSSRNCSGSPTAMVVVGRPYRKPRGIQYKTISVSCHNHVVANSNCRRWSALSKPRGFQYKTISVSCQNHVVPNSNCRRWSALPEPRGIQYKTISISCRSHVFTNSNGCRWSALPKPRCVHYKLFPFHAKPRGRQ